MDTTQTNMSEPQPGPSVTGAQALIESFLREGVDTIFGYPGGAIIPVYDALYGTNRAPYTPRRATPASAAAWGSVWSPPDPAPPIP